MKFQMRHDPKSGRYQFCLELEEYEVASVRLDNWDRLLLQECEGSKNVSDQLLALELLTRRIEEQKNAF